MKDKATISALMYSGARSPERDLTELEVEGIKLLVSQLTEKTGEDMHGALGFTGFAAFICDESVGTSWGVYALFMGTVSVWDDVKKDWIGYYDTVGLCAHMYALMNDTLQAHYREARTRMTMPYSISAWDKVEHNLENFGKSDEKVPGTTE
jgi:hypothetical protein